MAVASLATLLGTANAVEPVATLGALAAKLDLSHISRAPAKFDPGEVAALNAKLVHGLPYAHVEERLAKLAVGGGEDFWLTIRANLVKVSDAAQWWQVATGDLPAMTEDETMMTLAADLLPPEPWDVQVWGLWANAVKAASGRSGKDLFLPLRRALTGRDHGPEMKSFLPFIGRERAYARLIGARRPA